MGTAWRNSRPATSARAPPPTPWPPAGIRGYALALDRGAATAPSVDVLGRTAAAAWAEAVAVLGPLGEHRVVVIACVFRIDRWQWNVREVFALSEKVRRHFWSVGFRFCDRFLNLLFTLFSRTFLSFGDHKSRLILSFLD